MCAKQQGWKGTPTYNVGSETLYCAYTPITRQGDFLASKSWNPLTSTEDALKQFVSNTKHFTTQDLVKIVGAKQQARPSDELPKISLLRDPGSFVVSKIFRGVSNIADAQTLDRSWKSLKTFLPCHMVLKLIKTVGTRRCTRRSHNMSSCGAGVVA